MTVAACVILGALAWLALGVLLGSGMRSAREQQTVPVRELEAVDVTPAPVPTPEREPECDMRWN